MDALARYQGRRFGMSEGGRYGIVLALLLSAVIVTIVWSPGRVGSVLSSTLAGASVVAAVSGPGKWRVPQVAVLGLVVVSILVAALGDESGLSGGHDALNASVIVVLPAVIVIRLRHALSVNVQTVLGAICIYIVIGIFFASVEAGLSHFSARAFFAQTSNATSSDFMYYSFITLATVGYGDLTPAIGAGRALAVTEALMGQLYLVTVIALLVSNFGRSRQAEPGA